MACFECSWRLSFLKYSIFLSNVVGWLVGAGLIGIGIWVITERSKYDSVNNLAFNPSLIILIAGSIMFIIGFFGCVGAIRQNRYLLEIYVVLLTVIFVLEAVAGVLAFVYRDEIRDEVRGVLEETVKNYRNQDYDHDLQDALDGIQEQLECCGASNYNDWEMNRYYSCGSPSVNACGVPHSCCKTDKGNSLCGSNTRRFTSTTTLAPSQSNVYVDGCIYALENWFEENLVLIGWFAFALAFVQSLGIVFGNCLLRDVAVKMRMSEVEDEVFSL
ncbi:tetraspanin-5-like [Corticium candelabrum]|uniref:tetraspanin-5-like n=1 Tax=Corticium candelabrum TaxID=121492 RepID=UPI002E27333C|nr:tetraspanin-5-like [Corticium candelabrum]